MTEKWVSIKDGQAEFLVSSKGRVRSAYRVTLGVRMGSVNVQRKPGRLLSPWPGHNGYLYVSQQRGGVRSKHLVHRLVAHAFVPGYFAGATVNHIDGVKRNNKASNLEWVSLSRNTSLQWETGLIDIRGQKHPAAKLTDQQTADILRRAEAGERTMALAREYGVSGSLICKIKRGAKKVLV